VAVAHKERFPALRKASNARF